MHTALRLSSREDAADVSFPPLPSRAVLRRTRPPTPLSASVLQSVRAQELEAARHIQRAWRSLSRRTAGTSRPRTRPPGKSFRDALASPPRTRGRAYGPVIGRQSPASRSWSRPPSVSRNARERSEAARERPRSVTANSRISLLRREHTGVVAMAHAGKGGSGAFWIESEEVRRLTGHVVLCDQRLLAEACLGAGDAVLFRAKLCTDTRPKATQVRPAATAAMKSEFGSSLEEAMSKELEGKVVQVHSNRGYGFLHNPTVHSLTGRDALFYLENFPGLGKGERASFRFVLDSSGRPRVEPRLKDSRDAEIIGPIADANSTVMTPEKLVSDVHEGVVVDYFESRGHGFFRNSSIQCLLGKDVYFKGSEFPQSRRRGVWASFRVNIDADGKPRARNVTSISEAGAPQRARKDASPWRRYSSPPRAWAASSPARVRPGAIQAELTWDRLHSDEHEGVVKEFRERKGYGFLKHDAIYKLCGHDVFFLKGQLRSSEVGARVRFRVEIDSAGRPRVCDGRLSDERPNPAETGRVMTLEECLSSVHDGVVADYDEARGRGFLRNRRLHRLFGKDVLFHKGQFADSNVGDAVRFGVELDLDGRPRARHASEVEADLAGLRKRKNVAKGGAATSVAEETLTIETLTTSRHEGVIYQFSEAKGYGFIRNAEIHKLCGRDVFITADLFAGYEVGANVTFSVELTADGLPRARSVQSQGGAPIVQALTTESILTRELCGAITEYDEARGFGFIRNGEVHRLCGKDVFFRRGEFPGKTVGDPVNFRVALDAAGRPRTKDSAEQDEDSALGNAHTADALLSMESLLSNDQKGIVKEYHPDKAYGFVTNRTIYKFLGKDLFFRAGSLVGVNVGDSVSFSVSLDRSGRPRAHILGKQANQDSTFGAGIVETRSVSLSPSRMPSAIATPAARVAAGVLPATGRPAPSREVTLAAPASSSGGLTPAHACVVREPGHFNVVLGSNFGPMGLTFRAGCRSEIESIRDSTRDFWERQQGLRLGDRLVRVNGRLVEGRPAPEVLQDLSRRPILLTFLRLEDKRHPEKDERPSENPAGQVPSRRSGDLQEDGSRAWRHDTWVGGGWDSGWRGGWGSDTWSSSSWSVAGRHDDEYRGSAMRAASADAQEKPS